ncbi:MAG: hypothetical protein HY843_00020 [Bdellovibrio sp.]|nr:hypothetical protein [Bdellovibrio sp.]
MGYQRKKVTQSGQAALEYVLTIVLAIIFVSIIVTTFRGTVIKLWEVISREVSAPCIGCQADYNIRL